MEAPDSKPVGYQWLIETTGISTIPYWRETRILERGVRRTIERNGKLLELLPANQNPGDTIFDHLEFGLKKEGLHLELLRKILPQISPSDFEGYVSSRPTGKYARILWWLYETFTQTKLDLPNVQMGNYVDLLDPSIYVTGPTRKVKRQRINNNLLGTINFSPMVRSRGLGPWNEAELSKRCIEIMGEYPPEIFQRAVRYLYAKESKSSHEIERESPDQKRAAVFISMLEQAWHRDFLVKDALVELQQVIVDPRYANKDWRGAIGEQVYVGETIGPGIERIHYAAPKPGDVDELMRGFLTMARISSSQVVRVREQTFRLKTVVPTLVAASIISFSFNFIHPFSDGNGRIHRFLLHHILARNGFGPEGIILPVSAVILNRPREYDQALESFSKPLMSLLQYTMDERQRMTVTGETIDFYRYIDCTELTRITIGFIQETIEQELPSELRFLSQYDDIRNRMREIVELPDRIADLFVKLCRQNGGTLSKKKRGLEEFSPLTDAEITSLESVVRKGLNL